MSAINVNSITGRTGTHGPVLTGVTTATNGLHVTGGSGNVLIGGTLPSSPNISLNANGSATMTGDLTVPSLNGGQLAGFRNLLINGSGVVAQRSTANGTAAGNARVYGLFDRWVMGITAGGNWGTAYSERDNRNAMRFNASGVTTFSVGQVIEYTNAWQLSGQTVTISGWIKAGSAFNATVGLEWQDTATGIAPPGAGAPVTDTLPVTTNWTYFSSSFTVPATPTLAGYASSWGLNVGFGNLPDNALLELQDIQLEPGPVATPFEQRPIGLELSLCKRYYESFLVTNSGYNAAGVFNRVRVNFQVEKRVTPTMTFLNRLESVNVTGETMSAAGIDAINVYLVAQVNATGDSYISQEWIADAEL